MDRQTLWIFEIEKVLVRELPTGRLRRPFVLMPGVADWFGRAGVEGANVAICTNQGGVGLRYLQQQRGWGNPASLPSQAEVVEAVRRLADLLEDIAGPKLNLRSYISFACQTKRGWGPVPPVYGGAILEPADRTKASWRQDWRKPGFGMLTAAWGDFAVRDTVIVSTWPDDQALAEKYGLLHVPAGEFFMVPEFA